MADANPEIAWARGATAMRRSKWSRPVALALEHGLVTPERSFLDYGCGHGDDFRSLRELGFDAIGWDPAHLPDGQRRESDVVNLGFVLNTIENVRERGEVLRRAHALARQVLVVAVRVDRSLDHAPAFADGVLTSRGTFQKLYTQTELREYVTEVLGVEPVMADLGIAYVFRDDAERARYLATTTFRRRMAFDLGVHDRFRADPLGAELIARTTELGRLPSADEFAGWTELATEFGGVARVGRLVLAAVDADAFAGSLRERAEDILTYMAKLRFAGVRVPKLTALPLDLQRDIRVTWGSLKRAQEEALVLLFSLGREPEVRRAMRSADVGKVVGDELYVHVSALDLLAPVLRLAEFAARRIVGEVVADVIKFAENGRAVSFLQYPDFDTDPHPGLRSSVRVYLPLAKYEIREYGDANPFILHRKELFVAADYPGRSRFEALSRAEESAGLLGGSDIGTRRGWLERLAERGLALVGHQLVGALKKDPVGLQDVAEYDDEMGADSTAEGVAVLESFLAGLAGLKVHRAGNEASLKKPALLLAVLGQMQRGALTTNQIRFVEIEAEYKRVLEAATGKSGGLAEPFVRLSSSGFWRVRAPAGIEVGPTKRVLTRADVWAEFDAGTHRLLSAVDVRDTVITQLLDIWVPAERRSQVRDIVNTSGRKSCAPPGASRLS